MSLTETKPSGSRCVDPDRLAVACAAVGGSADAAFAWEAEVRTLCPAPELGGSNLAAGGDPVEFQFVWSVDSGGVDTRVTVDTDPAGTPGSRLARCIALAPTLSIQQQVCCASIVERRRTEAHYGGWISSRCRNGVFSRKLYLEIPAATPTGDWSPIDPRQFTRLPARAFIPLMAGFDPSTGGIELYGPIAPLQADGLGLLCRQLELPALSSAAIQLLQQLMQQRITTRMPTLDQGLSLATDHQGRIIALTWYAHCDALLGRAPGARKALLAFGDARGWNMGPYERLTAPDTSGAVPWHGVIGLTIGKHSGLLFSTTSSTRPAH